MPARWLFSQTSSSGTFWILARLSPSCHWAFEVAASPWKTTTMSSVFLTYFEAQSHSGRHADTYPHKLEGEHEPGRG